MPCVDCCNSGDCYGRGIKGGAATLVKVCEALDIERSSVCLDVSGVCDGSAVIDAFLVVSYRDRFADCEIVDGIEVPIPPHTRYEEARWFEDGNGSIVSGCVWPCSGATIPPPSCVATDIPLQECIMLTNFYTSNGGAGWTDNTNWNTDPAADWFGVTVAGGNVDQLNLNSNNVINALPTTFPQLTELRLLNLSGNTTAGTIPANLNLMQNLLVLNLSSMGLTGTIPSNLSQITTLRKLDLRSNSLTGGIPSELGDLSNLTQLFLQGNNTLNSDIPTEIGNLTNLQELTLQNNGHTGAIPTAFENLVNLTKLQLTSNSLTGSIPTGIADNNTNFVTATFGGNSLSGNIPLGFANSPNLSTITFNINNLTGLDAFVAEIYNNRTIYTDASPNLLLSSNAETLTGNYVAPPGVGMSDSDWSWNATTTQHDPLTGKATAYALVNDPNGEGTFNLWTISFS